MVVAARRVGAAITSELLSGWSVDPLLLACAALRLRWNLQTERSPRTRSTNGTAALAWRHRPRREQSVCVAAPQPEERSKSTFDLELRPKWGFRLAAPSVAAVALWFAVTDPRWQFIMAAFFSSSVAAVSWYGAVVVIEPTILWRTFPNRWRSVDLSALAEVDTFWGGREPHLELWVTDRDGSLFTLERRFWHPDWRILFGYVAKWAQRAHARDPSFKINERTIARLTPYRHLVE